MIWVGLAALILAADFSAGPLISLSILFLVPVVLAARLSGGWWGVGLGVLMPLAHLGFTFLWKVNRPLADSVINDGIRMAVLVAVAVLMARMTRQEREIRVLRGLLPVCAFCKKIRTEDQRWQPIESYITERSEASFTHTFCPECGKAHYGELYDQIEARQSPAPGDKPKAAA
jgi:hypothetical protein